MLEWRGDTLYFAGLSLPDLVGDRETPFFLFDQETLEENYRGFVRAFTAGYPAVRVYFSVKTNCELGVLRILSALGAHGEVATPHELTLALKAGFPASRLVIERPYLHDRDLEYCLREGVGGVYVDSADQLEAVRRVARDLGLTARVSLRVNLGLGGYLSGLAEAYLRKFGIPEGEVLSLARAMADCREVELAGLTTHLGSQHLGPRPYVIAVERLVRLAARLEAEGFPIGEINLGGGFPSPSLVKTTPLRLALSRLGLDHAAAPRPIAEFGATVSARFAAAAARRLRGRPVLAFEPGRAIASTMGIAVTRVRALKREWVILDVSHTCLPESLFFAERRILPARRTGRALRRYNLAGATLNSADVLAIGRRLPRLEVGDLLVVQDAGAYSISRASRFANLNPPVYLIDRRKELRLIRRGETVDDVLGPMEV